jgi:membrane-associated PAP2 superfamily phosphatase
MKPSSQPPQHLPKWLLQWPAWVLMSTWPISLRRKQVAGLGRVERLLWWCVALTCAAGVAYVKSRSATSCPWDLQEFGGTARYVHHWLWGMADGGGGRCFPSGHASTGFAFVSLAFALRLARPALALRLLGLALAAGVLLGAVQVMRGAHYPSHVLWSAAFCWGLCLAVQSGQAAWQWLSQAWRLRAQQIPG